MPIGDVVGHREPERVVRAGDRVDRIAQQVEVLELGDLAGRERGVGRGDPVEHQGEAEHGRARDLRGVDVVRAGPPAVHEGAHRRRHRLHGVAMGAQHPRVGIHGEQRGEASQVHWRLEHPRRGRAALQHLHEPAVALVHRERITIARNAMKLGVLVFVVQKPWSNCGATSQRHSSGSAASNEWIAANPGWTSAQRSNSHSAHARRVSSLVPAGTTGYAISYANGARSAGSSASSSCRMLVPDRAGPVMKIGAGTGVAARRGVAAVRVDEEEPRAQVTEEVVTAHAGGRRRRAAPRSRGRRRGGGTAPPTRDRRSRRARWSRRPAASSSSGSSATSAAAPPTPGAMSLIRRTQSGRGNDTGPTPLGPVPLVATGGGR